MRSCPTSYRLLKMPANKTKKISLGVVSVAAAVLGMAILFPHLRKNPDAARTELLSFVTADATSIIFIDVDHFRNSPFLTTLNSWAPRPAEDSDYTQYLSNTGFDYERDLSQV